MHHRPPSAFAPEGKTPVFAAFSPHFQVLGKIRQDVLDAEGEHFGDAGAGIVKQQKQQPVPASRPRVLGRFKDGFNLLAGEETQQGFNLALEGNGQNASGRHWQFGPEPVGQVTQKSVAWPNGGFECGQCWRGELSGGSGSPRPPARSGSPWIRRLEHIDASGQNIEAAVEMYPDRRR